MGAKSHSIRYEAGLAAKVPGPRRRMSMGMVAGKNKNKCKRHEGKTRRNSIKFRADLKNRRPEVEGALALS